MSVDRLHAQVAQSDHPERIAFWFARHPESEGNTEERPIVSHDTPLTELGKEEAAAIVGYLKAEKTNVTHIFSSPNLRARDGAQIIAEGLDLTVEVLSDLSERNWGDWNNLPWEGVSQKLAGMDIETRYQFVPRNGESWQQMEGRLLAALEAIAARVANGEDVIIMTHRGCLRAVLPILADASHEQHEQYSVPLGSLSKFSFESQSFDFLGLRPHDQ